MPYNARRMRLLQEALAAGAKVRDSLVPRDATDIDEGVAALNVLRTRLVVRAEPADEPERYFDAIQLHANHAAGSKTPLDDGTAEALAKALREARDFWNNQRP